MASSYAQVNRPSALLGQPLLFYAFLTVLIVWNIVMFVLWRRIWQDSAIWTYVLMLLFSVIPMLAIGLLVEKRSLAELFDFKESSLMFMIGDTIGLPLAGAFLSLYAQSVDDAPDWVTSRTTYWLIAVVSGFAAAYAFHFLNDAKVYEPQAFNSPTKIYHDFGAYPLLFGTLFYGLVYSLANILPKAGINLVWIIVGLAGVFIFWFVPRVRVVAYILLALLAVYLLWQIASNAASGNGWWFLAALVSVILLWLVPGLFRDLADKLDARKLHPLFDWEERRVIPYR